MKKQTKAKQIVVRFDNPSYEKICDYAHTEHRGLGDFVRHAVLIYMEEARRGHDSDVFWQEQENE